MKLLNRKTIYNKEFIANTELNPPPPPPQLMDFSVDVTFTVL